MPEWLSYPLTFISGAGLAFLGFWLNRLNDNKKQKQMRYDKFYSKYIELLLNNPHYKDMFCGFYDEINQQFIDMIDSNILNLLDTKSQKLCMDLLSACSNKRSADNFGSEEEQKQTANARNIAFAAFNRAVFDECNSLRKALGFPKLTDIYKID